MKQRVIDDTNLMGYYDLEITWSAANPPGVPPPTGLGPAGVALFMSTAKEQLGLRFTEATETVDYFVVDRLAQPTEP